ncbi:MAG: DEAD/DEAH box helicase family protein [Candidatus Bathyarchaeia archaeon]
MKEVTMPYIFDKYQDDYNDWKNSGYPGCKTETIEFIEHLLHRAERQLWPHQKEAILRVIYLFEVKSDVEKASYLLKIVTGGGKSLIIASIIGWLYYAHREDVNRFIIIVPNLIVKDRLAYDFIKTEGKPHTVFEEWSITPDESINQAISAVELESGSEPQVMLGSDIIITNIQELYTANVNTAAKLNYILKNFDSVAIFNDEAHNTRADEFEHILKMLEPKTVFRLDTTATPERADGYYPNSNLIYRFDINDALLADPPIIKDMVVYKPETTLVEITYTNAKTGEKKKIDELDKDFEEAEKKLKPFQWIMDEAPLKLLVDIAIDRLNDKEKEAKGAYKPLLFIVTMGIEEAKKVRDFIEKRHGIKTLLVTEDSDEKDRAEARAIGHKESPYKAVVSVFMLREGWDVPEVSVILLLRRIISPVFGQQIIGRGLRKINKKSPNREILSIVDHPKMQHDWLWNKMHVARIRQEVLPGDSIEEEPLPRSEEFVPKLVNKDKLIVPKQPKNEVIEERLNQIGQNIKTIEADKNWRETINKAEYNSDTYAITKVKLDAIKKKYIGKRFGESIEYSKEGAYATAEETADANLDSDTIKEEILSVVDYLLEKNSISETEKGRIYSVIFEHITNKFLNGKSLSKASKDELNNIMNNLENIEVTFSAPVLKGIIEEVDNNE